jgi:hypothetical protein
MKILDVLRLPSSASIRTDARAAKNPFLAIVQFGLLHIGLYDPALLEARAGMEKSIYTRDYAVLLRLLKEARDVLALLRRSSPSGSSYRSHLSAKWNAATGGSMLCSCGRSAGFTAQSFRNLCSGWKWN